MIFETAPEKTPYSVFGEKEARLNRREPTVSITVRFPKALAGRLGERAKQDHQSVSTLLRRYAELGLNGEDYARQTDPIRDIICEEITHSVRQQTDRIAAMLNRLTILSASAYYANLAFVTAFVDQDRYTSFEKIERISSPTTTFPPRRSLTASPPAPSRPTPGRCSPAPAGCPRRSRG